MKAQRLILMSLIVLVAFLTPGGTPVGAGTRAADSQLAGPNEPALAFNSSEHKIVIAPTTGTTTRVSVGSDGTQGNDQSAGSAISADDATWESFCKYDDKHWSYTDCSILVMAR